MCKVTLHETTRSRTNTTHLIASLENDSKDENILNSFLEDLYLFITFFEKNQTKMNTANKKSQMYFIEELIRENFASEPFHNLKILCEARASVSTSQQNHISEKTSGFSQK